MKSFLLFIALHISFLGYSQTTLVSWNMENFGKSKSAYCIDFMANTLKEFDIIAVVEVVAGPGGAQAVAKLTDELNRKGSKWDYRISDPTFSSAFKTERYAFIWKTSKVKLKGKPWLEQKYKLEIEREPYFATFEIDGKTITIGAFHAITKNKKPENEIKYFSYFPLEYPKLNFIFAGDFNCPQSNLSFDGLKKMGYSPILINQKTSLKQKCVVNDCLASEFDNMFYSTSKIKVRQKGVISFYKSFSTLKEAKTISDHLPIWMEFSLQ